MGRSSVSGIVVALTLAACSRHGGDEATRGQAIFEQRCGEVGNGTLGRVTYAK